ncbi:MAG TPA: LuxR C-terminal-related transcriptional regulator [Nitrospirales bacterium]|nr:LuxR C-terminal-related transcriptional regulator [Nitrospirales bacterium]
MPTVLLIDDQPLRQRDIREAILRRVSEIGIGESSPTDATAGCLPNGRWGLILVPTDCLTAELLDALNQQFRAVPIVAFIAPADGGDVTPEAFYRHHLDELVRVITRVLCPSSSSHTTDRSTDLSDREYEVLRLIASGHRLSEIARKLSLSANTVSTYRARMLGKLKMRTNAQLTLRNYDARRLFVQ